VNVFQISALSKVISTAWVKKLKVVNAPVPAYPSIALTSTVRADESEQLTWVEVTPVRAVHVDNPSWNRSCSGAVIDVAKQYLKVACLVFSSLNASAL
jgi:hypothetical protein